jgi:hypothetical protein
MKRVVMMTAVSGLLVAGALVPVERGLAWDAGNPPAANKRQSIRDCMSRQMIANKSLSYINAAKLCTDKVKMQGDTSASNTAVKPLR